MGLSNKIKVRLTEHKAWCSDAFVGEQVTELSGKSLPPMIRRRLSPLGRVAVECALQANFEQDGMPCVFASRFGDSQRTLGMLAAFQSGEGVSPTTFTTSVHNAVAGIYSIHDGSQEAVQVVSAGSETVLMGLVEAYALLSAGEMKVLYVYYDEPLPEAYSEFTEEVKTGFVWACLVEAASDDQPSIELAWSEASGLSGHVDNAVSPAIGFYRSLRGELQSWRYSVRNRDWVMTKHA